MHTFSKRENQVNNAKIKSLLKIPTGTYTVITKQVKVYLISLKYIKKIPSTGIESIFYLYMKIFTN